MKNSAFVIFDMLCFIFKLQKQSFRGFCKKQCPKYMWQTYTGTSMLKCDFKIKLQCNFIEITYQHWCSLTAIYFTFFQNTFF